MDIKLQANKFFYKVLIFFERLSDVFAKRNFDRLFVANRKSVSTLNTKGAETIVNDHIPYVNRMKSAEGAAGENENENTR